MIYPIELSKLYMPYINEYEKAFSDFLKKGSYIDGSYVEKFENEMQQYLHARYVVGCGNGTDALELALRSCKIGKDSEVITTANTYYATARAIKNAGAIPVFCDVDDNALIDITKVESLITKKTKAIIPVHLYGMCADMHALNRIAKEYNLMVIEDCSHAFGTKMEGQYIGADSVCACFSLYPTKNLGAFGDAGFIATNSADIAMELHNRRYYTYDRERVIFQENSMHTRMDAIQAALLSVSLKHVEEWNEKRKKNRDYYVKMFKNKVPFIKKMAESDIVPYVFPIIAEDQKKFSEYLIDKEILPQIHYKPELHRIPHLSKDICNLPHTEFFNNNLVSIPVSETLSSDEIKYIATVVYEYFQGR